MAVDLEQLGKERIYRVQAPSARVLADLQRLREVDTDHEKKQAWTHNVGCGTLVFGVGAGFFGLVTMGEPDFPSFLLPVGLFLVVVGIVAFVMRGRYARLNLENRRYELLSRVVRLLEADIAPQEPLNIEFDLRPGTDQGKFTGTGQTPSGWNVKSYVDRWLSVQGRLMDGTHLRLEMTERIDERRRTKRGRSGKMKTKTRTLSDALIRVRLQVKPEKYQHLGRLGARAQEAVTLPEGTWIKSFSVEADRLDLTVLVKDPWSVGNEPPKVNAVQVVAMSLLSLYQVLNLSRAIAKKAAHP